MAQEGEAATSQSVTLCLLILRPLWQKGLGRLGSLWREGWTQSFDERGLAGGGGSKKQGEAKSNSWHELLTRFGTGNEKRVWCVWV